MAACALRLKHICQYLCAERDVGLHYPFGPESCLQEHPEDWIVSFSDASFASTGSASHTGQTHFYNGRLVHWASSRQTLVSQSSCEAELIAALTTFNNATNLQLVAEEHHWLTQIRLLVDNSAALSIITNRTTPLRSHHISIKAESLRNAVERGVLSVPYVDTDCQRADGLTKALGPQTLRRQTELLFLFSPTPTQHVKHVSAR